MSGHSKWSKVKHQKATTDVVKAREFTKAARGITIAVMEGGGVIDPDHNFRLRLAIQKARDVNMPKENISRAIEKGKGTEAAGIEQVMYEGYGPGGVALLIEAATDNRNRTVSQIKNALERAGGTLTGPGSASFLFTQAEDGSMKSTLPMTADEALKDAITRLREDLEVLDDVQSVYANII